MTVRRCSMTMSMAMVFISQLLVKLDSLDLVSFDEIHQAFFLPFLGLFHALGSFVRFNVSNLNFSQTFAGVSFRMVRECTMRLSPWARFAHMTLRRFVNLICIRGLWGIFMWCWCHWLFALIFAALAGFSFDFVLNCLNLHVVKGESLFLDIYILTLFCDRRIRFRRFNLIPFLKIIFSHYVIKKWLMRGYTHLRFLRCGLKRLDRRSFSRDFKHLFSGPFLCGTWSIRIFHNFVQINLL